MKLEELIIDLKAAGASETVMNLAIKCFELGRISEQVGIVNELTKMPLNDTAHSIAIWIKERSLKS